MEKAVTVSELSRKIKLCLETRPEFNGVWVKGELSGITYHSSGHIYFTLKDKDSTIQAAFFRNSNIKMKFKPLDGQSVIVLGNISVYEKRGNYQLIVSDLILEGVGEIQQKIEELKKKLSAEGLFSPERKKAIPSLPKRIGIATSPTGAAFRDIIKVALRRYPNLEIILAPAKVQGDDAPQTIVKAIRELNRECWRVDVIIAGRGGGSMEDLLAFSDEAVVREFAASRVPIISAVGHQIDHPLSDEAADYAAPTPSAAAEYAVPDKNELWRRVSICENRANAAVTKMTRMRSDALKNLSSRKVLTSPQAIFEMRQLDLDHIEEKMKYALRERISAMSHRLVDEQDIARSAGRAVKNARMKLAASAASLENLSPLSVLSRGYSVALDGNGKAVKSVDSVNVSDNIKLIVSDGTLLCAVSEKEKGDFFGKEKKEN